MGFNNESVEFDLDAVAVLAMHAIVSTLDHLMTLVTAKDVADAAYKYADALCLQRTKRWSTKPGRGEEE